MKDPHKYNILYEVIAKDNIQRISELLAIIGTKNLIPYVGYPMLVLHKRLCNDVDYKSDINHLFGDGYDIVQTVALLLCEHIGERLNDVCYTDKNGKHITLRALCNREICRQANRMTRKGKPASLESLPVYMEPRVEMKETYQDYTVADTIIESLELNEMFITTLECRMSGMSYPEIGRIVGRSQSTVWEYCRIIQKKYTTVYGAI